MMASQEGLRPALGSDAAGIARVFVASLPDPWSAAMIADGLRNGCRGCVASGPEGITGVVLLQLVPPEAEILQLAVLPSARRQGLGRRLVRAGLAAAAQAGATEVYLEVRPSNAAALALYAAEGFRQDGQRRAYYRDGEDALVLRRGLRHPLPEASPRP